MANSKIEDLIPVPQEVYLAAPFFRFFGGRLSLSTFPRLAPWAVFFRRFAADFVQGRGGYEDCSFVHSS